MGMDVIGLNPASETGEYFRANVWTWHPLWHYCDVVAPEITCQVELPHTNDQDGLDGENAKALAAILYDQLQHGYTAEFIKQQQSYLDNLPDEDCNLCNTTGTRTDLGDGPRKCNKCGGHGSVRPFVTKYNLIEEKVRGFADFLSDCGGFAIC